MTEAQEKDLQSRLVVSHNRQGKCRYDPQAKQELIRACLRPGISTARMALKFGLNANQLRAWIGQYLQRQGTTQGGDEKEIQSRDNEDPASPVVDIEPVPMFVPVVTPGSEPVSARAACAPAGPSSLSLGLQVRLPNGVELDFGRATLDEASILIQLLGRLPCSGSTRA
ncbi:transposase [Pseudomonas aeruginosa]|uniref:transposase n=1 Tax=Pseudomonas aeruginosa TaxID=287 RepID=UPI003CC5C27F